MKYLFSVLIISFIITNCFAQREQSDCRSFKTGKFIYADSAKNTISITRKRNKQIEVDVKNKITTKLRIKWISDCEYQLTQIWSNNKTKRKQGHSVRTIVITRAYGTDRYEYTCKCTYGDPNAFSGSMIRIKE